MTEVSEYRKQEESIDISARSQTLESATESELLTINFGPHHPATHGVLKLRSMIQEDPSLGWRTRYNAVGTEELAPSAPTGSPAINVYPPGDTAGA